MAFGMIIEKICCINFSIALYLVILKTEFVCKVTGIELNSKSCESWKPGTLTLNLLSMEWVFEVALQIK